MLQKVKLVQNMKIMYLERPGCNLCMGNQEKAAKGDTVLATSTRLFQEESSRRF
jgi:aconitase B